MKITFIDLPLRCSEQLDSEMVLSEYGWVCSQDDIKVLDAFYKEWKDGEPMPEILKERISK